MLYRRDVLYHLGHDEAESVDHGVELGLVDFRFAELITFNAAHLEYFQLIFNCCLFFRPVNCLYTDASIYLECPNDGSK